MRKVYFTEEQFDTLYELVNEKVESLVESSIDYQDSDILNENEDLLDVQSVLEEANKWVLLETED
jgi:cystathionine beta-lyase family protein involved in aluminum resistance